MAANYTSLAMTRLLYPLMAVLGAEFTSNVPPIFLAGADQSSDTWIDLLLVRDEPVGNLMAFESVRLYTVRIRYIRRRGGAPTTISTDWLQNQIERLKRTLIDNANTAAGVYWLDGQIGLVNHQPAFEDMGESAALYEGAEIEWQCKIPEAIS